VLNAVLPAKIPSEPKWIQRGSGACGLTATRIGSYLAIEDTPPDAAKRVSTGFVFGSVAEVDGAPAVAINGIYMQRKTDSAANSVLDGIVEQFAKPMGVRSVVVATKYGGDFNIDRKKWQPGDGHSLWRPRAIMNRRGNARGELETKIYDDLGNLVNELDELDSHSWRQVITQ